jgi:hypothetical protein
VLEQFVLEGIVDVLLDDDVFGVTLRAGRKSHTNVSPCLSPHKQIIQSPNASVYQKKNHDTRSKRLFCKQYDKTFQYGTNAPNTPNASPASEPPIRVCLLFICLFAWQGRARHGMTEKVLLTESHSQGRP